IGSREDAFQLRALAANRKAIRPAAVRITQRLADPIEIRDLGQVEVWKGGTRLRIVRRKVLGLVCFLSSRPSMAATRDEVLDALWPDLGSDTAGNSLHQTIYFLRRVFEPDYREGLSAGYVTYDGEVVAMNASLVDSQSRRCWRSIRQSSNSDLPDSYLGRFALDFAYEDWAADYRNNLHAAVLAGAEGLMARSMLNGDAASAIRVGHQVLAIDPEADAIELALLRAYKASGRHAAAAEQYGHYSAFMREELGIEPPSLEDV
ncbi:MAG: BTAD domain-containing putative transcriptional regulator, partial [Candidatus Limnocylindrales bacterium]